jgi:hypothetical protein
VRDCALACWCSWLALAALAAGLGAPRGVRAQVALQAPTVDVVRIGTPPRIDGRLDDEAWKGPPQITRLTQVYPIEGRPVSRDTEIWLRIDDRGLYIGVRCHDDPAQIHAQQMVQDAPMLADDRINILIDPFHDERTGYFFQVNALGNRQDALSTPEATGFRVEWDTIWYAKTRIDERGWTLEVLIPFQSVPLNPLSDTWGFDIERNLPVVGERARWGNWTRNKVFVDPQNVGVIRGMRAADGRGVDVKPSGSASFTRDHTSDDSDRLGRPALDVFFRPTSSVTTALTLNTDFSETPVDDRQTNLTRFALFFPETRDFFLQDAGMFDFGGLNQNGIPFFSRNVGLVDNQIVNLDAGLKATGRVGDVQFGVLQTRMAAESGVDDPADLSVVRARLNVLESSEAGIIFTNGDPRQEIENSVVGADFQYRNARFRGNKQLRANFWFQRSQSSGTDGREAAFGTKLDYPNDTVNWHLSYTELQENFNPRLGFVNRVGIREYEGLYRYRIHPTRLRSIDASAQFDIVEDSDGRLETRKLTLIPLEILSLVEDKLSFRYLLNLERPPLDFFLHPDALITADDYRFDQYQILLDTAAIRPVRGKLELTWGEFYGGRLTKTLAEVELRPDEHWFLGLLYEQSDARLPPRFARVNGVPTEYPGDFTLRLVRARLNLAFTTAVAWLNTIQYDNLSDSIGINSRLRWEIEPGRELFFVINQGYDVDRHDVAPTSSQFSLKLGWTQRY